MLGSSSGSRLTYYQASLKFFPTKTHKTLTNTYISTCKYNLQFKLIENTETNFWDPQKYILKKVMKGQKHLELQFRVALLQNNTVQPLNRERPKEKPRTHQCVSKQTAQFHTLGRKGLALSSHYLEPRRWQTMNGI